MGVMRISSMIASVRWSLRMLPIVALAIALGHISNPALAVTYELDNQGRLLKATYSDGSVVTFSYDGNGNRISAVVTPATDTTPPSTPTDLAGIAVSTTQIDLSWAASTDASLVGYKLERCEGAVCSDFAQVAAPNLDVFNDSGLSPGTTYRYRVRAYDAADLHSDYSNVASATTHVLPDTSAPSVPVSLEAEAPAHNRVNLVWDASIDVGGSGVAGYYVYRGSPATQIGSSVTPGYTDHTVTGNTTYTYRVAAYDNANPPNVSAQSGAVSVTTPLPPDTTPPTRPANLKATAPSSTRVNLTWNASTDSGGSGLAGYYIHRNGVQIGTSSSNAYSDLGVSGTTTYTYTVSAYDNATPANISSPSSAVTITTPDTIAPTKPTGLTASAASPTKVNLSWNAATDTGGSGLAGYRIYRDGTYRASVGTTTSYSDTTVVNNTTYKYSVASYDHAGNISAQTSQVSVTTPLAAPAAPASISGPIENNSGSYTITWSSSTGATRYELWESRLGSPFVKQHDGTDTFKFFSGKTTGEYTYRAKACNAAGCSAYSNAHMVRVCRPQCL